MNNYSTTPNTYHDETPYEKRERILENFKNSFMEELYHKDGMSHAIVELLARDADPYDIIEKLLKERLDLIDQIKFYLMKLNPNSTRIIYKGKD